MDTENHQPKFSKILIQQESDSEDSFITESLWGEYKGVGLYQIQNIPFYAFLYSADDLVRTEVVSSENFVRELVAASGNSTIRMAGDVANLKEARTVLRKNACDAEMSTSAELLAVNIPRAVSYKEILLLVKEQCEIHDLDYEEACISEHHANAS